MLLHAITHRGVWTLWENLHSKLTGWKILSHHCQASLSFVTKSSLLLPPLYCSEHFFPVLLILLLFSATCSQSNGFSVHRNGTTTNGVTNGISRHPVFPPASSMTSASMSDVTAASDDTSSVFTQPRERKKYVKMFLWKWDGDGEVLGFRDWHVGRRVIWAYCAEFWVRDTNVSVSSSMCVGLCCAKVLVSHLS